jgi:hypothetical protein
VVHWNGAPRSTTFLSENESLFPVSFFDLQTAGTNVVILQDPVDPLTGNQELFYEVSDVAFRLFPIAPAPDDTVQINYSGLLNDGGVPIGPTAAVNGTNILLEAETPTGNFLLVVSP